MLLSTSVLLLVATCVAGANNKNLRLEEAFRSFTLVPILIDEVPQYEVSVRFSSEIVNLGNKIPAYSASIPPYIYYEADPKSLYTIIVTGADGDSAAAPIDREFLHACLVNTPGNNLEKSTYLTPYYPINSPPGGGYTRIVILVFKQSKKIDTNTPFLQNLHRNNTRFSTRNFAATYGLGKPLCGNFFLTQRTICPDDQEIAYTCTLQSS